MKTTPELLMPTASWLGKVKSAAIVLLVMLFSSVTAWADDSGSCGRDLTWEFTESDSTLTISGTGDMYNFGTPDAPWQKYKEKIKKVILHEGLMYIGSSAFKNAVNLKEITIPTSVTKIANGAFANVGSELSDGCIFTVAKGSKLGAIGEEAFKGFKGEIDLLECAHLLYIDEKAFYRASYLKKITIPANVWKIAKTAFEKVGTGLSSGCTLTFAQGSKLIEIVEGAFKGFKGEIDLRECTSLTGIASSAFYDAVNLEQITIPTSVERIEKNAFANVGSELDNGCTLTFVQGSKLKTINSNAFPGFSGNIDLRECTSLTTIDQYAFSGAVNLKKITIPASVERFEAYAFENVGSKLSKGCTLTVAQGSQLKYPQANAFNGFKGDIDLRKCTSLTIINKNVFENYKGGAIRLPASLQTIYANAFINSKPTDVFVAFVNCVLYVNKAYRNVNLGTGYKGQQIRANLGISKNSSKKLEFYRVSFDEVSMSFDEQDKTYVISNEQGLIDLGMKMCTREVYDNCKNLKFKLAADLDFTNIEPVYEDKEKTGKGNFMPIGKMGKGYTYPFDGQGHTIKGLKYDGGSDIGLYYRVSQSGSVKNLTLIAPSFSGDNNIGGIVGNNLGGTITNCSVIAPSISGDSYLGGIAGNNDGKIDICNVIEPSISGTGKYIGCIVGRNRGGIGQCIYDISTELYIYGYEGRAPAIYSNDGRNKPVLHLNLGYGITSNDAITVSNYTMAELYDRVRLDAYRAGYDLVDYKSEEVTVNDGLFEMPKKNVSVTAVWEPMNEIIIKGSLIEGINWTTFYCGDAGYSIDMDVNACAYTATVGDDVITLHLLGKVIPKGTAVIIVSEDNEINMIRDDVSAAEYSVNNDLRGVDMPTARTSLTSNDANTLYMLSNKNNHFGFHSFAGANVPARKAFFTVPSSANARPFSMVFEDETTAIRQLRKANAESPVFDLNGRAVNGNNLKPGIYVKNGKKVVIK